MCIEIEVLLNISGKKLDDNAKIVILNPSKISFQGFSGNVTALIISEASTRKCLSQISPKCLLLIFANLNELLN